MRPWSGYACRGAGVAAGSREEASFPPSLGVFLAGGEGQRVEFKREVPAERRLVRLLAGLANAGGGVVLFGVDDRGRVVGLPDPAEVEWQVRRAAQVNLEPPPRMEAIVYEHEGKGVLALTVAPPPAGPVSPLFDAAAERLLRVNDHLQPVARLPRGAELSHGQRLAAIPARVRVRYLRMEGRDARGASHAFRMAEYAQTHNISMRAARRDLVLLSRVFLVVEVEKGLYEIVRE